MSMKDNDYLCPHCKGHLNIDGHLVFATRTKRHHKGLLLLETKVGSYDYKHHDNFHLEKGELVDFECPICQKDLTSKQDKEHAMIIMFDNDDNQEYDLYFSKVAGNQSTYVVAHDNIDIFGDDALDMDDLFF